MFAGAAATQRATQPWAEGRGAVQFLPGAHRRVPSLCTMWAMGDCFGSVTPLLCGGIRAESGGIWANGQ